MARIALRIQLILAGIVIAGVVVQVYLIASYIFGADALEAHRGVGFAVHTVEVLVLVAALFAKNDRVLSLALAVIGTVQLSLAAADEYVGGLHGLFAMIVLGLAGAIHMRAIKITKVA